jgi:hypothetical protein
MIDDHPSLNTSIDYQRLPVLQCYGCRLSAVGYRETFAETISI